MSSALLPENVLSSLAHACGSFHLLMKDGGRAAALHTSERTVRRVPFRLHGAVHWGLRAISQQRGKQRPRPREVPDVVDNTVHIIRIATGEVQEQTESNPRGCVRRRLSYWNSLG
jgi:hypothetical protein